jgi:hypothetical protein
MASYLGRDVLIAISIRHHPSAKDPWKGRTCHIDGRTETMSVTESHLAQSTFYTMTSTHPQNIMLHKQSQGEHTSGKKCSMKEWKWHTIKAQITPSNRAIMCCCAVGRFSSLISCFSPPFKNNNTDKLGFIFTHYGC